MKKIQVLLLILIFAGLINFVREGRTFHMAKVLPFCDGQPIHAEYAVAGILFLGLILWGIGRINRNNEDDDQ